MPVDPLKMLQDAAAQRAAEFVVIEGGKGAVKHTKEVFQHQNNNIDKVHRGKMSRLECKLRNDAVTILGAAALPGKIVGSVIESLAKKLK